MNVIIDYGRGNLRSVKNAMDKIGLKTEISKDIEVIKNADSLIIPGVGAFADAMESLKNGGYITVIRQFAKSKKPILGICLGMQILYEKGLEFGEYEGLGLLEGTVEYLNIDLKVPHMGWNNLEFENENDPILKYISKNEYVYFVHSYYAKSKGSEIIAFSEYEKKIPAIVRRKNIYGIQFHPEKSGKTGEKILRAYKEIIDDYISSN